MTWWSTPLVDDVGDGLRLTEPPPMLLAPGDFGPPSSSFHLSMERRRAFMKKLPTVVGSSPNCLAIVTCISLDGRFVSCNKKMQLAHLIPSFNDCILFFSLRNTQILELQVRTLKMACSVRLCRSVKTKRGFLGAGGCSTGGGSSLRLHGAKNRSKLKLTSITLHKVIRTGAQCRRGRDRFN